MQPLSHKCPAAARRWLSYSGGPGEEEHLCLCPSCCRQMGGEAGSPGGTVRFSVYQAQAARCRGRSPAQPCGFGSRIPPRLEMSQGMAGERGF